MNAADNRSLAKESCVPCRGGVPPMDPEAISALLPSLAEGWAAVRNHQLQRTFAFPDFARALEFTNRLGAIAEEQGHHPDIQLSWGKVVVDIWTHKIDGLTRSDFVLAAKIDQIA